MSKIIRGLLFLFILKPFMYIVFGLRIFNYHKLSIGKQSIIIANHSSHIDTLCILSIFPLSDVLKIHPIAAADYFFTNKIKSFLMKNIIGAVPIVRKRKKTTETENANKLNVFENVEKVLEKGDSIILFPEGTRSIDSDIHEFKNGIAILAKKYPNIPITPLYISGADKILPKNDFLFVPYVIEINVGDVQYYNDQAMSSREFSNKLYETVKSLRNELEEWNK